MSKASVCRCVRRVTCAITKVASRHIRFPTSAEEHLEMQAFSSIAHMPGCIGYIDGTLIPIRSLGGDEAELYRCRKDFFALNVMAMCNASLVFTTLVVNWGGSAHDSRIFNSSRLCQALQDGQYRGFLLGDSAYPLRSYLLTPCGNPNTPHQHRFNVAQVTTRN